MDEFERHADAIAMLVLRGAMTIEDAVVGVKRTIAEQALASNESLTHAAQQIGTTRRVFRYMLNRLARTRAKTTPDATPSASAIHARLAKLAQSFEQLIDELASISETYPVSQWPTSLVRFVFTGKAICSKTLPLNLPQVLWEQETELILEALTQTNGRHEPAAKLLGLKRTTLLGKLQKRGLLRKTEARSLGGGTRLDSPPHPEETTHAISMV